MGKDRVYLRGKETLNTDGIDTMTHTTVKQDVTREGKGLRLSVMSNE